MRILGIILLVVGVIMAVFNGFSLVQEKKVADIGPIEINKKEKKHIGWSPYVTGAVIIAGAVLLITGKKKN